MGEELEEELQDENEEERIRGAHEISKRST
jgi:hypothetical protein